jgi:hypothetical protein
MLSLIFTWLDQSLIQHRREVLKYHQQRVLTHARSASVSVGRRSSPTAEVERIEENVPHKSAAQSATNQDVSTPHRCSDYI